MSYAWWQTGVVYQIYPRSFKDTTSNGVGDLQGIIEKLDYLDDLGIDAIWISPFYPSPMKDHGYDVADYCNIEPMFGDLDTFDRLLADHSRGPLVGDSKVHLGCFDRWRLHTTQSEQKWEREGWDEGLTINVTLEAKDAAKPQPKPKPRPRYRPRPRPRLKSVHVGRLSRAV